MSFKTILVPVEQHDLMSSSLSVALLLARKFDSYVQGFALRVAMPSAFALGDVGPLPIPALEQEIVDNERRSRSQFESFMQERDIPPSSGTAGNRVSFGWLAAAPEDESFIGSHGRAFDITVVSRLDADSTGLQRRAIAARRPLR